MSVSPELEALTRLAIDTKWENLPESLVSELKYLMLDSVGCALAGISVDPGKMYITLGRQMGGPPESSIIGIGDKVSCVTAAMVNGQLINVIDYDAMSPGAHVPPYIIAPMLAVTERERVSGKEFLLATSLGFEIAGRVASAISSGARFEGSDKQIIWSQRWGQAASNFGVAAGVGKILKLNHNQMMHAMGTAGHLCQVQTWIRYTFSDHRYLAKYGVPGWQNTGGVIAALLAQMGYMGDISIFDSQEGFGKCVGYDTWNPENIVTDIGRTWISNRVVYKPYPCCRQFQTELDCFLKIVSENNLTPDEIESVKIFGHPTLDTPAFTNRELTSIVDIQFGPSYIFSMAANGIPKGVEWQDMDTARSPRIINFAKKVSYKGDADFGQKQISRVEVVARGKLFKEEKPFTEITKLNREDLINKYKHNASRILTQDKIEKSLKIILQLEELENIADLLPQITI